MDFDKWKKVLVEIVEIILRLKMEKSICDKCGGVDYYFLLG